MKSEFEELKLNTEFPCLMEYRIGGEVHGGIFLVKKYATQNTDTRFSVCAVVGEKMGVMYFKPELDPEEWFPLPKGAKVTLIN